MCATAVCISALQGSFFKTKTSTQKLNVTHTQRIGRAGSVSAVIRWKSIWWRASASSHTLPLPRASWCPAICSSVPWPTTRRPWTCPTTPPKKWRSSRRPWVTPSPPPISTALYSNVTTKVTTFRFRFVVIFHTVWITFVFFWLNF